MTTNFEPVNQEDVKNKSYQDEKLKKIVIFPILKTISTFLSYNTTDSQLKRF